MGIAAAMVLAAVRPAAGQVVLASGELRILGARFVIEPEDAAQTVPRGQATGLRNRFVDPADPETPLDAALVAEIAVGLTLKGELSGPGLETVVALSGAPGALLAIPPLPTPGNYVVDNLRLEDAAGTVVLVAPFAIVSAPLRRCPPAGARRIPACREEGSA